MRSPSSPQDLRRALRWASFALFLGAIAIGFGPILVRVSQLGPVTTAFWRIALALPVMLCWMATPTRSSAAALTTRRTWRPLALAGVCFAGDLTVWHWSIHLTSVANATLEANLASVFVALIGWLFLGTPLTRRFVLAMGVALVGTALLIGKNLHISERTLRGDALGVLSALFYSGYLLAVKEARQRQCSTARIMALSGFITAALLWPVARWSGEPFLPADLGGWLVLIALAVGVHAGGQSLIAYALAELPAAFAAVGLLVQPATAAIAAWALLGEALSAGQMVGGAILLYGIWLARPSGPPPPSRAVENIRQPTSPAD